MGFYSCSLRAFPEIQGMLCELEIAFVGLEFSEFLGSNALGAAGLGFTPHVILVKAGEMNKSNVQMISSYEIKMIDTYNDDNAKIEIQFC
ncbi:uncharacterized protein G2W53_044472 [Senna tora]|uniref:Uncharacterized protein n=1 Tax=Senna tora TaxID=362788 RepID=A0A834W1P8_9FABA|nr:uncharacterized protein G2W53_044472 [Senna tora]